tara:strand:+ start:15287 stop:15469 length:183 start_codon:yes stop_codon:yes gene_type:complete
MSSNGELNDARDEIFNYLDELRELGTCNMMEAPRIISDVFALDIRKAREIFTAWIKRFEN